MSLPQLPYQQKYYAQKRKEPQIIEFRGVNYRDGIKDGEMQFTENMSSRRFPFLSPRQDRLSVRDCVAPQAVWAGDKLVLVDNGQIYYDVLNDDGPTVVGAASPGPKQFAHINSKLVIWPDKTYIDMNTGTMLGLEAVSETETGDTTTFTRDNQVTLSGKISEKGLKQEFTDITVTGADVNEEDHYYVTVYNEADVNFTNGAWELSGGDEYNAEELWGESGDWLAQNIVRHVIMLQKGSKALNYKRVKTVDGTDEVITPYTDPSDDGTLAKVTRVKTRHDYTVLGTKKYIVELTFSILTKSGTVDMRDTFNVGDAVAVVALDNEGDVSQVYTEHSIIRAISAQTLTFDPGTFAALFDGTDTVSVTNAVRIIRDVPDMDFICHSENRLWGVSNADVGQVWDKEKGEYVTVHNRVIHASALGDPTNFYVYDGLSTDSYSVAVAESGDFTGCAAFGGDALFFKERKLYRIYGDYPATYMMYTYDVPGITAGSHLSVGVVNDTLFYLSREGIHVWDGASARLVSYKLGPGPFSNGVAGVCGTRYYISMQEDDAWSVHVYDTLHDVWYREDATQAIGFAEYAGNLYMLHDQTLDQLEIDSISWHERVLVDCTWYFTPLPRPTASDLGYDETWDPATWYGLDGLTNRRFHIPESVMAWLAEDESTRSLYIDHWTTEPRTVNMTTWALTSSGYWMNQQTFVEPLEYGVAGTTIPVEDWDLEEWEERDVMAVQYRQWAWHATEIDRPGTCWSYSGSGTLAAGTYHFHAGDKVWQFTTTEDVDLGLYNIVLYRTNIRRCRKTGGYSTMSWNLREGNGGTELAFLEEPAPIRFVFGNEFSLCFTLPCDIPQGRNFIYNTTWPDRIDVQETDNGGYVQVPVTIDSGYYVYSTTLGDNVPAHEFAGPKGPSQWRAVLATADEVIHERKHYRWIRLRAEVPKGSTLRVYAAIGNGEDKMVYTMSREESDFSGTINIPLQAAVRNDKIRITLEGIGDVTIKSVVRAYNMGSVNTL